MNRVTEMYITKKFGTASGQCPFAVPNQSENGNYNLIWVWLNEISLCVCRPWGREDDGYTHSIFHTKPSTKHNIFNSIQTLLPIINFFQIYSQNYFFALSYVVYIETWTCLTCDWKMPIFYWSTKSVDQ